MTRSRRSLSWLVAVLIAAAQLAPSCADPRRDTSAAEAIESLTLELRGSDLHYLAAGPAAGRPVLLLHGMRYHSGTWSELGTIEELARAGYRVLALDLPGFGLSDAADTDVGSLLWDVVPRLSADRPVVLVVPSMSGAHAFPLLIEHPEAVAGFVALAPAGVDRHQAELDRIQRPTLVLWGENDRILPVAMADKLAAGIRGSTMEILQGAGHAAYLERPEAFHRILLAFLERVAKTGRW